MKIKMKKIVGTITIIGVIVSSSMAGVYAAARTAYFSNRTVTPSYSETITGITVQNAGKHSMVMRINSVSSAGTFYITMPQRRADGTYGGGAGINVKVGTLSTAAPLSLQLNSGSHHLKLTGGSGINMVTKYLEASF